ncbi:hypothetical protein N9V88_02895, partial [bacterium]|nr:hypothetical protein [bacterium]
KFESFQIAAIQLVLSRARLETRRGEKSDRTSANYAMFGALKVVAFPRTETKELVTSDVNLQ